MIQYQYGGKRGRRYSLAISDELVAVRTHTLTPLLGGAPHEAASVSSAARGLLGQFQTVAQFPSAGVEILRAQVERGARALRDRARGLLKREKEVRFAGRVLCDRASGAPAVYTENFFVKFDDDERPSLCRRLLKARNLTVKRELAYARNAYFVEAKEGTGTKVFEIAAALLEEPKVELCHPELVWRLRSRMAFDPQWHLKQTTVNGQVINAHANVEAAWSLSEGAGTIVAVIDNGVDLDHEEFRSSGKIVAPRDVTRGGNDPRPGSGDNHGTACAGVACADGRFGASGVAPRARLMPVRLASGLGSQAEADAFIWAAQHGADVISCSWGPADGDWWDPSDPVHQQVVPLPDSTRLAIDWTISNGRNGKGCVITWAAGNGNESVDNDGYASYEKVTAVAACNDLSRRSAYSDVGRALWCAFPSNDGNPTRTPGIWTTDRTGPVGYNSGQTARGDAAGNYTNSFGGTSSACPGAAGVAALVLARNPSLRWDQVKEVLKGCCDRIDTAHGHYDANGHSEWYGYGRLNALKAVQAALPPQPGRTVEARAVQDVPIRDLRTSKLSVAVAETSPLQALRVTVDIEHTYIGDLVVTIQPPAATGVKPVVLHNRTGGGTDNIKQTYDAVSTPGLLGLNGKNPAGTWTLVVQDKERYDTGKIVSVQLEMTL
jgi:subtilisin family serine protease